MGIKDISNQEVSLAMDCFFTGARTRVLAKYTPLDEGH